MTLINLYVFLGVRPGGLTRQMLAAAWSGLLA